ncbi:MAG: hypothetical protein ACJ70Z_07530 [Nitrososphaera sp.]
MKFCLLLMARYCISITDEKWVAENLLVTKPTESFEETFEVLQEGHKDWGTLAIAGQYNKRCEGNCWRDQSLTTAYQKCKMMLMPILLY